MSEVNVIEGNKLIADNRSGAKFSECRKYRYELWRIWDDTKPVVMFIGLNPSTANESKDDPTIRRVKEMARVWGYGGVYMMNLFAWVTPYPEELHASPDPIGKNDWYLVQRAYLVDKIIFAWGNFKEAEARGKQIAQMFPNGFALHINKNGSPKHPLYVKSNIVPLPYNNNSTQ
jgi:hypothetical protein